MPSSHKPLIGFLTSSTLEPWAMRQWEGVVEAARDLDAELVSIIGGVLRFERFDDMANVMYDLAASAKLDGLLVWSTALGFRLTREELADFLSRFGSTPMVSMEMAFPGVPGVLMDDYGGMRAVVDHLIEEHGRRRIAFIRGPDTHQGFQSRYRAYRDSLERHGLSLDSRLVTAPSVEVDGEYSMCRLLDEAGTSFDAVVGADDYLILAGLPALAERGIRVPDDVAVAGFDDMPEAMVASPPLTTAVPPFAEMGRRGMELLLERISGRTIPETVILPIGLARRNSCGCPERFETQRGAVPAPDLGLARSLRDQFALEARGEGRGDFLDRFRSELEKAADAGADPIGWLQVMAAIQRDSAPWFSALPSEARLMAADLGARAQELVAETIRRQLTRRRVTLAARHSNIRALSERLSGVYDLERQMDVVASLLVRMGIAGCYISLFADPEDPTGEARLVLAQGQEGRRVLPPEGLAFPASELVPGPRTAAAPGLSRLAQALFFGRERLGFVVFEIEGKENALLCEILRWEISGVLKGAAEFRAQMAAAAEKATMLKELQHRIKNSISIIAGIVGLESEEAAQSETRTALSKLQTRIMAIGDLYEALYDSGDAGKIDLADYLSRVVDSAAKGIGAGPGRVSFESRGEGCEMDLKRAVSLGLIVNELVTDSLKHAFPDGRSGDVGVRLYREAEELAIEVWDDGVGFPAGFDPAESESFGLKMVSLLAAQVRGKLAFSNRGPGANTSLRLAAFPKET